MREHENQTNSRERAEKGGRFSLPNQGSEQTYAILRSATITVEQGGVVI
jgi:hypothetical protein